MNFYNSPPTHDQSRRQPTSVDFIALFFLMMVMCSSNLFGSLVEIPYQIISSEQLVPQNKLSEITHRCACGMSCKTRCCCGSSSLDQKLAEEGTFADLARFELELKSACRCQISPSEKLPRPSRSPDSKYSRARSCQNALFLGISKRSGVESRLEFMRTKGLLKKTNLEAPPDPPPDFA